MFVLYCSEDGERKLEHMHSEFCAAILADNTLILRFWRRARQKLRGGRFEAGELLRVSERDRIAVMECKKDGFPRGRNH